MADDWDRPGKRSNVHDERTDSDGIVSEIEWDDDLGPIFRRFHRDNPMDIIEERTPTSAEVNEISWLGRYSGLDERPFLLPPEDPGEPTT